MKLSLVVLTPGKQEGKVLPITLTQFVIGRDPQCHLRPASALISKRHCALLQRDGKAFVRDFGSTNGTFVNEQPVKGEVELNHEDKLKIGPLLFGVSLENSVAVNRPTPAPPTKKVESLAAAVGSDSGEKSAVATKPSSTDKPPKGGKDEDDIAAMLLALQDDGVAGSATGTGTGVPEGSTVMELNVPAESPEKAKTDKEKEKEKEKGKAVMGNTADAAKSILEKYTRRSRSKE